MRLKIKRLLLVVVLIATALPLSAHAALTAADIQLLISLGIIDSSKADAALALVSGGTPPAATPFTLNCSIFTRDVALGSSGDDVRHLQEFLISKNYLSASAATLGSFGAETQTALAAYQVAVGITPAVGYFGQLTRTHLNASECSVAPTRSTIGDTRGTASTGAYSGTISTIQGKHIDNIVGENVMTVTVNPERNNVTLQQVRLNVQVPAGVNPARYIQHIELRHKGSGIASRTNANNANWRKLNDTTYTIVLTGNRAELDQNKRNEFSVIIIPERTGRSLNLANFVAHIPENGVALKFANGTTRTWGSPNTHASFTIGKRVSSPAPVVDTDDGDDDTDNDNNDDNSTGNDNTTNDDNATTEDINDVCSNIAGIQTVVPANYGVTDGVCYDLNRPAAAEKPELRNIRPNNGSFGEYITLTGRNFAPTGNHIVIRHPQSNSELTLRGFGARNNTILFRFPGKNRDFYRPNGSTVSGKTGAYFIRVISNNKTSNAERFGVQ